MGQRRNYGVTAPSWATRWTHVQGFVGHYDFGPQGYVEASSPERAVQLAHAVVYAWPRANCSAPRKRWFKKSLYRVKIWTE